MVAGTPALAGGVVVGGGIDLAILACLNNQGSDFQMMTPVGYPVTYDPTAVLVAPSANGGVWSLSSRWDPPSQEDVPYDLKASALQPFASQSAMVLRYIDLTKSPAPILTNPQPVSLQALSGNYEATLNLSGVNFAEGMYLAFGGNQIPLTLTSPTTASIKYAAPGVAIPVLEPALLAGNFSGQPVARSMLRCCFRTPGRIR
jgi:hypothetical protein